MRPSRWLLGLRLILSPLMLMQLILLSLILLSLLLGLGSSRDGQSGTYIFPSLMIMMMTTTKAA